MQKFARILSLELCRSAYILYIFDNYFKMSIYLQIMGSDTVESEPSKAWHNGLTLCTFSLPRFPPFRPALRSRELDRGPWLDCGRDLGCRSIFSD